MKGTWGIASKPIQNRYLARNYNRQDGAVDLFSEILQLAAWRRTGRQTCAMDLTFPSLRIFTGYGQTGG